MSFFAESTRNLGSKIMQIKTLTKILNKGCYEHRPLKTTQAVLNQKLRVKRFVTTSYRTKCHSSHIQSVSNPVKCYNGRLDYSTTVKDSSFSSTNYENPPFQPFVTNWRWYADINKTPEDEKDHKLSQGKLDSENEDDIFKKMDKARLEQIKKMLNDKSLLRGLDKQLEPKP